MARAGRKRHQGGENVSGYFRQIFLAQPELLESKSNAELLERWMTDHGETSVPNNVRSNLANLKSMLRKRFREGRPLSSRMAEAIPAPAPLLAPQPESINPLEVLEEQIDDSLSLAKNLDREGLAEVISLLRRARNAVVWKMGE